MNVAVVGLGYVGLPLAIRLTQIEHNVLAIDKDIRKINLLNKKTLPFAQEEPDLLQFFKSSINTNRIQFTTSYRELKKSEIILVCVDTPILKYKPNYSSLISAVKAIAKNLGLGQIIVLESTLAPKTTENIVIPLIEKESKTKLNKEFYIAVAPERIRPNYIFKQLTTLPRIIGVSSEKIITSLAKLYKKITSGDVDFTNILTAEVAKTVENTYRDVQIAFANEMALASEELGVNVYEIRRLVNKDPYKDIHLPGAGVGGHCIPKDPWLLASAVKKTKLNITKAARKINDSMPKHMYELLTRALGEKNIDFTKAKVAILGFAYAPDSDDARNSPTQVLISLLEKQKIKYVVQDPYVSGFKKIKVNQAVNSSDAVVFMVAHTIYKEIKLPYLKNLMKSKIIIDGRNLIDREKAKSAGFLYKGIGNV